MKGQFIQETNNWTSNYSLSEVNHATKSPYLAVERQYISD